MKQVTRKAILYILTLSGALTSGFVRPAFSAEKPLEEYAQSNLKDLAAKIKILSHNDRELSKIGKDFPKGFTLGSQEIWCKEPGKVRFQGKKGLFTIRQVTNGNRKLFEAPAVHKVDDISKEPGKGDSIADLGLITPGWVDTVEYQWLRTETRDGKPMQVYQYWRKEDPRARHTITVDPTTKTVVENIAHFRSKKKEGFKKKLVYSAPQQINGVWVPTRVSIYNTEDKRGGEMQYESIRINVGLEDKLFNF